MNMPPRSAPLPRSGESGGGGGGGLTSAVMASILAKVETLDQLTSENEGLRAELGAARGEIHELESRSIRYPFLQDEYEKLTSELKSTKAQLVLAEEEARLAKPMRDALVRQLQNTRDSLSNSQSEVTLARSKEEAACASRDAAEAELQRSADELDRLRVALSAARAETEALGETRVALEASQAECVRLRAERSRLLEVEQRQAGASGAASEEVRRLLLAASQEAQEARAALQLREVELRSLRWSLASAEESGKGAAVQLAATRTQLAEAERALRAARSGALLAEEAAAAAGQGSPARAAAAPAPRPAPPPAAADAAELSAAVARAEAAERALAARGDQLAVTQARLAAVEKELSEFADSVLADSETMAAERGSLRRERDAARREAAAAETRLRAAEAAAAAAAKAAARAAAEAEAEAGKPQPPARQPAAKRSLLQPGGAGALEAAVAAADEEAKALARECGELEAAAAATLYAQKPAMPGSPGPIAVAKEAVDTVRDFLRSALKQPAGEGASQTPADMTAWVSATPQQRVAALEEAMAGADKAALSAVSAAAARVDSAREFVVEAVAKANAFTQAKVSETRAKIATVAEVVRPPAALSPVKLHAGLNR